eukprot:6314266-Prymnesium_polylepis.1
MALRALGVSKTECSLAKLRKRVPTSSVWTVDLAYLLADFGIKFRFLTTTLGVDPTYEAEPFYRQTIDADSQRVNKLFEQAASKNVAIERRSLAPESLQVALGRHPPPLAPLFLTPLVKAIAAPPLHPSPSPLYSAGCRRRPHILVSHAAWHACT